MNDFSLLGVIVASLRRAVCRARERARLRAELAQLDDLDARTLADIGISRSTALATSAERRARCA
jgi:uncharacterized protein YjiS (DUF1127 family)